MKGVHIRNPTTLKVKAGRPATRRMLAAHEKRSKAVSADASRADSGNKGKKKRPKSPEGEKQTAKRKKPRLSTSS